MDPNQAQTLDQDAVRLAKAIAYTESRGKNLSKNSGASGEGGIYQWMPDTWASTTKKYNLDSADFSPVNQNKAAYMTIKDLKDQGKKPDQIAAFWNSGKTEGWEDIVSTGKGGKLPPNKHGVEFSVPEYVSKVKEQYGRLNSGQQPADLISPSTVGHAQMAPPEQPKDTRKVSEKVTDFLGLGGAVDTVGSNLARIGVAGKGLINAPAAMMGNKEAQKRFDQSTEDLKNIREPSLLSNITAGANIGINTAGVEGAKPLVAGLTAMVGKRLTAKAAQEALNIAGEKLTTAATKSLIKVGGIPGQVRRGAEAIQDMVRKGLLKSGDDAATVLKNSEALRGEIGSVADDLVTRLRSMPVTPILQPQQLDGLFTSAMVRIEKNPYLDDAAKSSAQKMFELFKSKLPKGRDIDAADLLEARKLFDQEIASMKPSAFDPRVENATSLALRAIRQEANGLVAKLAPGQGVPEALARQTALYDVLENVAAKGTKAVQAAEETARLTGGAKVAAKHPYIASVLKETAKYALPFGLGTYLAGKAPGD